eukprot:10488522-Ditylum_brightwellii.AAC.1
MQTFTHLLCLDKKSCVDLLEVMKEDSDENKQIYSIKLSTLRHLCGGGVGSGVAPHHVLLRELLRWGGCWERVIAFCLMFTPISPSRFPFGLMSPRQSIMQTVHYDCMRPHFNRGNFNKRTMKYVGG